MSLPLTVVALDLGNISHFLLDGTGVYTRCRRFVAVDLSLLAPSVLKTSLLIVLVLFWIGGGSLLSGKALFSTRRISQGGVSGLIPSTEVFFLLLSGPVLSGTPRVHIAGIGGGLEYCLCLCVDGFLHGLFSGV